MRGVDLADERRRHRDPRDAAQVGAPRRSRQCRSSSRRRARRPSRRGRASAPTRAARRPRAASPPRPRGSSCVETSRSPSAAPRRGAVDAHHGRVGDERDRAVAGHELAEPLERTELVVHAGRGEHDAVGVAACDARPPPRGRAGRRSSYSRRNAASSWASGRSLPRTRSQAVSTSTSTSTVNASPASACGRSGVFTAPPPSVDHRRRGRCSSVSPHDRGLDDAGTRLARLAKNSRERAAAPGPRSAGRRRSTGRVEPRGDLAGAIVVLPAPMNPISATCRSSAFRAIVTH